MQATHAAGTTLKATVSLPEFPASGGWTLSYRLAPRAGGAAYTFAATADGDDHAVNVPRATTGAWLPGAYTLSAWVDNGTERHAVASESGSLQITPDPATMAAGVDTRSQAEIALAHVQALLAGKASNGVESYKIGGRELRSYPLADLLKLESKLKADVDRERMAAGKASVNGSGIRRILVRSA